MDLGTPKPWKIKEKSHLKIRILLTSFLYRFFSIFVDLGSILGGPRASQNWPKIEKIRYKTTSWRFLASKTHFGSIFNTLAWIWVSFFQVLKHFSLQKSSLLSPLEITSGKHRSNNRLPNNPTKNKEAGRSPREAAQFLYFKLAWNPISWAGQAFFFQQHGCVL